jgi:hypothetical protein
MAKVLSPLMSLEARGSVGGLTATKTRSGHILRVNSSPVQPRTSTQQAVRYVFQQCNNLFLQQSILAIASWEAFANAWTVNDAFGSAIKLTALNWFIGFNSRLLTAGFTLLSDPPLNPNCSYNPSISIAEALSGDIKITYSPACGANQSIWVQWTGALPKTSNFLKKSCRQHAIVKTANTSPYILIPQGSVVLDTSRYQITAFPVDEFGRAGTKTRFDVYPVGGE